MIIRQTLAPSLTTSALVLIFKITLPSLDFITAHPSLVTAQMGSVTPLF